MIMKNLVMYLIRAIDLFLDTADLFTDEATTHDIVAYREMMRFDNKDAYSIAYAIKQLKKDREAIEKYDL